MEEQRPSKLSFSKIVNFIKQASVEPTAILMMTATLNAYLIFQNVMIHNICRVHSNLTEEVCIQIVNANPDYAEEEVEIQKYFSNLKILKSVIDHTFPILYVIFMGPWSDYYGRKVPLLLPLIGFLIQMISGVITSMYYDRIDPYAMIVFHSVSKSLTGGEVAYLMAAFSYICDITTKDSRTIRSGLLQAAYLSGVPLGFALGGRLVKHGVSYPVSFGISGVLLLIGIGIVILRTKNTKLADREEEQGTLHMPKSCWTVINPKNNVLKVALIPLRKRDGTKRLDIILLLIAFVFSAAPIHGEFTVTYLFFRQRVHWSAVEYGDFSTYNWFIGVLGVILSMGILSKWLKVSDPVVGFLAGISQMAGCFVYAFAYVGFMMYVASAVDMVNSTMPVIARSMVSKVVDRTEVGGLMSFIAMLETFVPLTMDPLYNYVYGQTVDGFEGSFYFLSAALTVPPQLIFFWYIIRYHCLSNKLEEPKIEDPTTKDPSTTTPTPGYHDNLAFSSDSINDIGKS